MARPASPITNLGSHTAVWLFPSYGYRDPAGQWRLVLTGAAYRPAVIKLRKRLLVKLLRRAMGVEAEELESALFQQRILPFIAAPHRGRRLAVRCGEEVYTIPGRSRRNGHFRATIPLKRIEADGWLDVEPLRLREVNQAAVSPGGRVRLLEAEGVSVISDIDDTIKETGVGCRSTLLQNTFLRDFREVAGMAERYRQWAGGGAEFHYVSSSPWQLYLPLENWRLQSRLPEGTFHLRKFHLGDHMLRKLLRIRRQGKARVMRDLMRQFPRRRFVLVGDSAEHDPEIYGALARRFPRQVGAIFLRDLSSRPLDDERLQRAMREVDPRVWVRYQEASQLPETLELPELPPICPLPSSPDGAWDTLSSEQLSS